MKTINTFCSAVALSAAVIAAPAFAADLIVDPVVEAAPMVSDSSAWYLTGFVGVTATGVTSDDEFFGEDDSLELDTGVTYGIAVGTQVFDMFRGELELSGTTQEFGDDDLPAPEDLTLSTVYLLGNMWWDLDTGSGLTPYLGGGLGFGWASVDSDEAGDEFDYDASGFAYQLGAGVKFDVTENMAIDLGYRFKAIPALDPEDIPDDAEFGVYQHVVQAGLSFSF